MSETEKNSEPIPDPLRSVYAAHTADIRKRLAQLSGDPDKLQRDTSIILRLVSQYGADDVRAAVRGIDRHIQTVALQLLRNR